CRGPSSRQRVTRSFASSVPSVTGTSRSICRVTGWAASMRDSASVRSDAPLPRSRAPVYAIAVAYFVAHLPSLAPSLEDIDSINFAFGLHHFDPALHQPHPPGYPVYIAL